ncbi:MAG: YfcE family phosphodiesterase [Patescibacteria group bacterium]|jgi:putative phosphoesterase|nr:YfcE family phosphodiesterase [Patescibacteria group bacterium]
MKIAIISDIHDNIHKLQKCLEICKRENVEKILCLGDVANKDSLLYLANNFSNNIFLVRGNACSYSESLVKSLDNIKYFDKIGEVIIDNLKIGIVHQAYKIDMLKKAYGDNFDFIFYGHTHKPWIEKKDTSYLANPGNLTGDFYSSSFAILDTKIQKIELKIINN